VGTLSKAALADALERIPLGAQANRLNMAFVLTGQQKQRAAVKVGISNGRFSQICNGVVPASEDEQKALAKHFGVPVSILFPDARESAA
jgi:transcriptional regulator with XRE-family HTH domain